MVSKGIRFDVRPCIEKPVKFSVDSRVFDTVLRRRYVFFEHRRFLYFRRHGLFVSLFGFNFSRDLSQNVFFLIKPCRAIRLQNVQNFVHILLRLLYNLFLINMFNEFRSFAALTRSPVCVRPRPRACIVLDYCYISLMLPLRAYVVYSFTVNHSGDS